MEIPTPALVVDLDRFERNLQTFAEHCRTSGCAWRPHAKTHKCPEIARRQLAAGAIGISTATVAEAEAMVHAGLRGVLLTSPIVERGKIQRMLALARTPNAVLLAVGNDLQLDVLAEAAASSRQIVDVLLDLDIGDRRTGFLPGEAVLEAARRITRSEFLRLRGLQAYAGHASHVASFEKRAQVSQQAVGKAIQTKELLAKAGLDLAILSVASTGTYNIDSAIRGVTELQCGSFIFMDADYRRIGGKTGPVFTDFQPSLTLLTTVIHANYPDRVTVDAGIKAVSTCIQVKPECISHPGLSHQWTGDEFGIITAEGGIKLPRLGERLEFIVPHCDPTVNLYDCLYAVRGERVEDVWPVTARRGARGIV
jgi:D-serine deaminase-like pyridoxal phosphate-dependent protein